MLLMVRRNTCKWDVATTHVIFIATSHGNPYVGSKLLGLCETDATHRHHVHHIRIPYNRKEG